MTGLLTLRNFLWLTTTSAEVVLFFSLCWRNLRTTYTAFSVYILSTIAQSALAVFCYTYWGFNAPRTSTVIWGSQGVVISLRFAATFALARGILSTYQGLWSLAKRVLGTVGVCTVFYSLVVAKKQVSYLVLNLDRGMELTIAAFVVGLLLFARFYLLPVSRLDRALAIGFSLYSCFYVVNDTLFETLHNSFVALWGYLDILTFLASLLIWIQAVYVYSELTFTEMAPRRMAEGSYSTISPELNVRLKHLNDQVAQLLHAGNQRS